MRNGGGTASAPRRAPSRARRSRAGTASPEASAGEHDGDDGAGVEDVVAEGEEPVERRVVGRREREGPPGAGVGRAVAAGADVGLGPPGVGVAGGDVEGPLALGAQAVDPGTVEGAERAGPVAPVGPAGRLIEEGGDGGVEGGVAVGRERGRPLEVHADVRRAADEGVGGDVGVGRAHGVGVARRAEPPADRLAPGDRQPAGHVGERPVALERAGVAVGRGGVVARDLAVHAVAVDVLGGDAAPREGGEEEDGGVARAHGGCGWRT